MLIISARLLDARQHKKFITFLYTSNKQKWKLKDVIYNNMKNIKWLGMNVAKICKETSDH